MNEQMSIVLTAVLLVLMGSAAQAQKLFANKAELNEKRYHYMDASEMYLGFYQSGDRDAALRAAADLYKGRMYEKALPLYELADSLKMIDDPEEIFGYFECLKTMKRYVEADALVKTHIKNYASRRDFQLHDDKLEYYEKLASFEGVKLELLALNNEYSDISPTVYNGWLYFVSTRPSTNNKEVHRINMQPFYNLYGTPLGSDMKEGIRPAGDFGKPEKTIRYQTYTAPSLPNGINKKYHDGPILATPSGNRIFFTTNWSEVKRPKKKGQLRDVNLLIYYCEKEGNMWSAPKAFPHNSFEYSNQHGFFDEKTNTLYFSSNMSGGEGGYDIWKSELKDGRWGAPVNMGPRVNTPRTEVFPSIGPDGQLFFSSNGWPGLGGLDLFMTVKGVPEPVNLMAGMNTELDDFGLVFVTEEGGFLVSNRKGGKGDDDIYSFGLNLKRVVDLMVPDRVIVGMVRDAVSNEILDSVQITVSNHFSRSYVTAGKKSLADTVGYELGDAEKPEVVVRYEKAGYEPKELRLSSWPKEQSVLDLSALLEKSKPVEVTETKPTLPRQSQLLWSHPIHHDGLHSCCGFDYYQYSLAMLARRRSGRGGDEGLGSGNGGGSGTDSGADGGKLVQVRILDNQKFIIYFDFDKFNIRQDAAEILAKVAYVLLEEYDAAEVMLTGHTDTRGSQAYNEQLSKNRVNTARKWLIDRGVDAKRIKVDYHGERKLAVLCADPFLREQNIDQCLTREEHQLNRRVEIEILNLVKPQN